ncbi:type II toxin-antitoxin system RelB/DinJ family antitoxin [Endozoicomonas sp. ALB122]|uniref:type II toxin-antitoxin system RelB/DinJ family antitoxin n=2 Tax=Endozoicomonas TaxID=305899 RepID=UPI003BB69975
MNSSQKYVTGDTTMAKETTVRARIDEALKEEAEQVLRKLGLTTSQAINLYFSQIVLRKGLPFDVVIPDKKKT